MSYLAPFSPPLCCYCHKLHLYILSTRQHWIIILILVITITIMINFWYYNFSLLTFSISIEKRSLYLRLLFPVCYLNWGIFLSWKNTLAPVQKFWHFNLCVSSWTLSWWATPDAWSFGKYFWERSYFTANILNVLSSFEPVCYSVACSSTCFSWSQSFPWIT